MNKKWCFLVNQAPFLIEVLGKLAHQVVAAGDECILVADSKIAEYSKRKYFPENVKVFSEIDWCIENYQKDQKEFQDLSWKEFFPEFDRFSRFRTYNYQNSVKIMSQSYQFANFILLKEKPDIIISEPPTGVFNGIFYFLCKKYKKIYLGLIESRISGRIDFYDLDYTCSKYEKTFNEINNISAKETQFAKVFIKNFISHKRVPSYTDRNRKYRHLSWPGRIKNYLKREKRMVRHYLRYILRRKHFGSFDYHSGFFIKYNFFYPLQSLRAKLRAIFQKNIFDTLNDNDKFFVYPLHLQPEASTSARATYFCDQINTIKNIAFSLPFPYKLYVKEHPAAVGTKPRDFYGRIKEIANTVLVTPDENVENLINKSQGAVVLTSTMGLEAILSGKPVYALGETFYFYHPLCRKINSFEELKQKIEMDLKKKPVIRDLESVSSRFIISYLRNTVSGSVFNALLVKDPNDYHEMYKEIKRMFLADKK